jgi:hypothetical protein
MLQRGQCLPNGLPANRKSDSGTIDDRTTHQSSIGGNPPADVVGYSRLMGADEAGTLAALKRHREAVFDPAVAAHNGRIVKLIGDGVIAEFGSVVMP